MSLTARWPMIFSIRVIRVTLKISLSEIKEKMKKLSIKIFFLNMITDNCNSLKMTFVESQVLSS